MTLRLPDSGADISIDGRRHAPSVLRNLGPILDVLRAMAPATGKLLEIASGSGQHAAAGAKALPGLIWQPTDANPDNLISIDAWRAHDPQPNLCAGVVLDAARPGWSSDWFGQDIVLIINLLHLIPAEMAATILAEAARTLTATGRLMVYGPFLRDGLTTSDGDAAFDASLRAQDATIGYKDLGQVLGWMGQSGLTAEVIPMPANNLMIIAGRG